MRQNSYRADFSKLDSRFAAFREVREQTNLSTLSDDLVEVAKETMQPSHVSLWLRPQTSSKGKQPA
jgi:hypothetical protein